MHRLARIAVLCLVLVLAAGVPAGTLRAQDDQSSYLTPFPEKDIYRVHTFGDWLTDGLIEGLREGFAGDPRIEVVKKQKGIQGLVRDGAEDDIRAVGEILGREPAHVVVVLLGTSDRQSMRIAGRWYKIGTPEWKTEYARRVDMLLRALKRKHIGMYWVGLPIMRNQAVNDDSQMINAVVRERTYLANVKFIDTYTGFADTGGGYSQDGPDLAGAPRKLRDSDGVGFTSWGYRKLAHFVEREIKRDIQAAKTERNIPLAGAEAEQQRIRSIPAAVAARAQAARGAAGQSGPGAPQPTDAVLEQYADHGRITLRTAPPGAPPREEHIEIVRPAIPAALIAHVTRRDTSGRPVQVGEAVAAEIEGGLTVLSSIAPVAQVTGGSRRNVPLTQTPYYKVLVKGEAQLPKPGRVDDFSWPRPQAALPPPARSDVPAARREGPTPPIAATAPPASPTPSPGSRSTRRQ